MRNISEISGVGKEEKQIGPEGQVWGSRYTGQAGTCNQGQILCPNLCMREAALCGCVL